ncbi:MAG: ABC transporter, ATP-binding/permease protein [Candidatus Woesebacteria bacterium GW2011_GWA1_37_8]|uniref:ABC transporter, ATP-binding/permease protein n=2 Tax=Candidatus Woeseibacteriota TaxID=1752722 RepID=A0A0G0L9X6_9BACT|nr:MAG: ABC transporter, ATP-binding/permease protein [Microgenomates group bacterium GW2011_GWC1_37_12b]KKQ46365.1 MAG: ABC transporter, ATP-binding/permease protein [Candidatus Woesebacteria bacterium GW2011_GWA1_37_8]KKQ87807.1 MAG: ABC transporter, ATP-binding/permease protein [Candidatus Woesebacteria bacterium GW2011_GWB1_38_8b]
MTTKKWYQTITNVLENLHKMLSLSYGADKFLTVGYYATAGLSAFFPIIASYIFKLLIDGVVSNQGIAVSIPTVLISILALRYVSNWCWDLTSWVLKETYFDYLLRYRLQNKLNIIFVEKMSNLDLQHLENSETQNLITKASDTLTWRPPDFLRAFSYLFNNFVSFISSFILLLGFGWYYPIIVSFFAIPRIYLRTKMGSLQWSIWGSGAENVRKLWYLQWLLKQQRSIIESRIFQSGKALLEKYRSIQEELYKRNKKPIEKYVTLASLPNLVESVVIFTFAYKQLPLVLSGAMTVGTFSFFVEMLSRTVESVGGMVGNLGWMYENNLYVNHFFEILNLPKIIKEKVKPTLLPVTPNPPEIEFKNVWFKYQGARKSVLKNISFKVNSKENVALVGKNGAGKTTIVKLLCRFYDVTKGEILINGVNIKDVKLSDWYGRLGTLFQDFEKYSFTIKENIILGDPSKFDEDKLIDSAKKSGAYEFIEKFPKKFDQQLGKEYEEGTDLSQGQWQKLAIARAFYEGAPILVLDEPTSAIDAEAEHQIFSNIHKLYRDKSLLFISHRFSTVKDADKIIVIDGGKIIEEGDHNKLMKRGGKYSRLFNLQAKAYMSVDSKT